MRKRTKAVIGSVLGLAVIACTTVGVLNRDRVANLYEKQASFGTGVLPKNYTDSSDYVILEIVPDISYAQMGYYVAGEEPIDLVEACEDGAADDIESMLGEAAGSAVASFSSKQLNDLEDCYGDFDVKSATNASIVEKRYSLKSGKKMYISANSFNKEFSDGLKSSGRDSVGVVTVTTNMLNNASEDELKRVLDDTHLIVVNQSYLPGMEDVQKKLAKEYKADIYKNESISGQSFKELDLNPEVALFLMKYVGKKKDPVPMIMDSSIYTNADYEKKSVSNKQYQLNRDVKYENNQPKDSFELVGTDSTKDLFTLLDGSETNGDGYNNNVYKLFLMSMFRDPAEFKNLFIDSGLIEVSGGNLKSKLQSGDAKTYWNTYSFLPCTGDLNSDPEETKTSTDKNGKKTTTIVKKREKANEKYWKESMGIYVGLASNNCANCNVASFDMSAGSFISMLNKETTIAKFGNRNATTNKLMSLVADLTSYIPLGSIEGRSYRVLDIEPAQSRHKYSLDAVKLERLLPYSGYSKKGGLSLDVVRMATAEFNTKIEELIQNYDMVYIGKDISGLHTVGEEGKKTCYYQYATVDDKHNPNKAMEGVIYAHVGSAVEFEYKDASGAGFESRASKDKSSDNPNNRANGYSLYAYGDPDDKSANKKSDYNPNNLEAYGYLRYSGNDITYRKRKVLEKFVESKLPLVVDGDLLDNALNSNPDYSYFNDADNNQMKGFLTSNAKQVVNLSFNYHTASADDDTLRKLTIQKPKFTVHRTYYKDSSKGGVVDSEDGYEASDLTQNRIYYFDPEKNNRRVYFEYSIEDEEDAKREYWVDFYIDKNADGTYDEKDGEKLYRTSAKGNGVRNTLSFNFNTKYVGPFTWMIKTYTKSSERQHMVCTQQGYGTVRYQGVKNSGQKVRVLQIQAPEKGKASTGWGEEKVQQVHLSSTNGDTKFRKLYGEIKDDYDMEVEEIEMDDFVKNLNISDNATDEQLATIAKKLASDYNMLIFGFADSYNDLDMRSKTCKVVQMYVDLGKSVLFTHDLTSQINNREVFSDHFWSEMNNKERKDDVYKPCMEIHNGKYFNVYLRDLMGLNRFGQKVTTTGLWINSDGTETYGERKNSSYYDKTSEGSDTFGFTYSCLMEYANFRFGKDQSPSDYMHSNIKSPSDSNKWVEMYGPYAYLYENFGNGSSQKEDNVAHSGKGWPTIWNGNKENYTHYASQYVSNVNQGQITKYPFDLEKEGEKKAKTDSSAVVKAKYKDGREETRYKIALTHGQYYQLNLEDEDTICWYTLSDVEKNSDGNYDNKGWYTASNHDGANNYYIYSNGNVTYSGVGHSKDDDMSTWEKMLFVNTMVASLRAEIEGPTISIQSGVNIPLNGEDRQVVYADVDADSIDAEFNKSEKIEFSVSDDSTDTLSKSDNYLYVTVEVQDGEKWKDVTGDEKYKVEGPNGDKASWEYKTIPVLVKYESGGETKVRTENKEIKVWKVLKSSNTLESGTTNLYTLHYPRGGLKTATEENFRMTVYNASGKSSETFGGVMRRTIFPLD